MEQLNKAQLEAVTAPPNSVLQILAGPGSGKTKVLTHRVCFLLRQGLIPESIILTTFTNKAANEMKERIGRMGADGVESKLITGTFHSICRRYLVKYGSFIGLRKGWGITDIDDAKAILKEIVKGKGGSIAIGVALNKISSLKSNGVSHEQFYAQQAALGWNSKNPEDMSLSIEMAQVYSEYENKLDSKNLLDFDDLLLRTHLLLSQNPQCVSNIQHVLVDEFQDTNLVQYQLMRLFAQARNAISIVGDPDQGIYGWRSAHAGNLKQMRSDYSNVQVVNLEQNYRSSAWILKCSMTVIEQDTSRFKKTLEGTRGKGLQPVMRTLPDVYIEAKWIAREIRRLMALTGGMIRERDIAILVRTTSMTRTLEGALASVGLRYRMVGGRKFFDREEIRDVLAYLKVIYSSEDDVALRRILNVPNRRLGDQRVAVLLKHSESKSLSMWDTIHAFLRGEFRFATVDKQAEDNIAAFTNTIKVARERLVSQQIASVAELIEFVRESVRYDAHLRKKFGPEADDRIANVEELKTFANEIAKVTNENELPDIGLGETPEESPLERFLGNITLMTDVQDGDDGKLDNVWGLTSHCIDGLEWPVVFVPGVYQGCIPHMRCEDTDEERRLLYVSMTRAKALLYLSRPEKNAKGDSLKLSVFMEDMKIQKLLATQGGEINVEVISGVLNRKPPPKEFIEKARKTIPSVRDEDFETPTNGLSRSQSFGSQSFSSSNSSQRREWRPQTTTTSLTTTQIGVTTTVSRFPTSGGPGGLPKRDIMTNVPPGATMGFISSRQVLSTLPPEQLTNPVLANRKANAVQAPKRSLPASFDRKSAVQASRAAIIVDRARPSPLGPTISLLQSSSPRPGIDVDALPSLSFSSPVDLRIESDDEFKDLPATSPLAPVQPAAKRTKAAEPKLRSIPSTTRDRVVGRGRGRGTVRGMKSGPGKNVF